MTVGELTCRFETADDCAIVTLLPALNDAPWSEIEQAGNHLLERVRNTPARAVIVDLTALNYMGSALVALIVRVWKTLKERDGRFVVVNKEPLVFEVLKIAGLNNLWTIVETREQALDAAGVSSQAVSRTRETRLLTIIGPLAVVAAAAGLVLLILRIAAVPGLVAVGLALGWAAVGAVVGAVTFARSSGNSRTLAGLVVAACVGIAVATAFFWPRDPVGDGGDAQAAPEAAPAGTPAAASGAAARGALENSSPSDAGAAATGRPTLNSGTTPYPGATPYGGAAPGGRPPGHSALPPSGSPPAHAAAPGAADPAEEPAAASSSTTSN